MQMRMEWVKGVWQGLQVLRTETLKYTDSEVKKGEYLSFDSIVEREGGYHNKNNICAAERYCRECQRRKGIWARYNPMTGRVQYLYVQDGIVQKRSKGWEVKKIETQTVDTAQPSVEKRRLDKPPDDPPKKKQKNDDEKAADAPPAGEPPTPKAGVPAPEKNPNLPKPKSQLDKNLTAAGHVRKRYKDVEATMASLKKEHRVQ